MERQAGSVMTSPVSSQAISVGDLVQVVRSAPCCGPSKAIGWVFVVEEIIVSQHQCWGCGHISVPLPIANVGAQWFHVSRQKRIPPLSELEGVKTEEDIREPA